MPDERKIIHCDCNEPYHQIVFDYWKEDGDLLIYAQLRHYLPWWQRLLVAINYVRGCDQAHIDYVEAMIYEKYKIKELRNFLDDILEDKLHMPDRIAE
ncbi:hypothetical protein PHIM7_131 [Sinorhizobium phage phiM7]|uniref:Uncharacterized protein n=2 Tax=Emdodecavirus TaxID=1980937 RepID=A0A0F6WCI5_9CAUD|nr:virion structural protein [Sinorhizobium phage phiN3]YP_009601256.1 virion structural protein [Sinorhizobium phage phiM7]AKF12677.1 hypothetical protein PHIM7_131 [Sinorhizobium phage phiM7]AKF13409.1 hypothetical protein PHIN3_146 [Sinorhizobium phage phiN3]